ncbi:MAG: SpoIID/LytB domain-containing protein [Oscillospiraceae bacterium]
MKIALLNIAALICAIAIFSGAIVYSASEIPVVDTTSEPLTEQDNFIQENDLLIGDLISGGISSEEISSPITVSQEPSSEVVSSKPPSSKPDSSKIPPSSKPSSSKPTPSSKPPPSSVVPPPSSEVISSEEPLSVLPSSETPPPVIEGDYAQMLEILAGAVQREIVGTNTNPSPKYYEAYKAQAVASHSYMEYHKARTGSYPTMSYSTPKQQTIDLVAEVLNELMYYNSGVINASYHAASGGYTQSASYIWGGQVPYLVGVESKYDDYNQTSTVAVSTVEEKLANNGIYVSGDASTWFDLGGALLTDGGFVDYISICGQSVRGRTLRETILGAAILKSPKIVTIEVSGSDFIFTTKGYGHGAGLSQLGAKGYAANEGWDYKTILTHYYSGITIA